MCVCVFAYTVFCRGNQQLCTLQAVQQFGTRLAELQSALERDKDTLAVLDVALQAGATSEVASSVRHVARLLSEKQDVNCQVLDSSIKFNFFFHNYCLTTCQSFSTIYCCTK